MIKMKQGNHENRGEDQNQLFQKLSMQEKNNTKTWLLNMNIGEMKKKLKHIV